MKITDNYSILHNTKLVEKIKFEFESILPTIIKNRTSIEKQWKEFQRIYTISHDENKEMISSRFSKFAKMPTASRSLKKMVSAIKRNALPYNRPFEPQVVGQNMMDEETRNQTVKQANRHSGLIEYQMFDINKLRQRIPQSILQYILYGLTVAKVSQKHFMENVLIDGEMIRKEVISPYVDFLDVFRWYIYPEAISDIEASKWMFEWSIVRTAKLRKLERMGFLKNVNKAIENSGEIINPNNLSNTSTNRGYNIKVGDETNRFAKEKASRASGGIASALGIDVNLLGENGGYTLIYDGYYREDIGFTTLKGQQFKEDGEIENIRFVYINGEICMARVEPDHPYIVCREDDLPNQFYQHSNMRSIFRLLYIEESILCQALENLERASGKTTRYDSRMGASATKTEKPYNQIDAPAGAYEEFFSQDTSQSGVKMVGFIEGLVRENLNDSPPTNSNINARSRGSRTEGGMELLTQEAMQTVLEETMKYEDCILVPLVKKFHKANQLIKNTMLIKTDRGDLGELAHSGMGYGMEEVSPDDIKVQAEYKWLGSVRIISETRLMENAMNFLAIISKIPLDTVDIDLVRILRKVWTVAFGQRDADAVIKEAGNKIPIELLVQGMQMLIEQGAMKPEGAQALLQVIQQASASPEGAPSGGNVKSMSTEPLMNKIN
jgi:hypothetical protein